MNEHNRSHNRWVDEGGIRQEEEKEDFIDRMYDIMNVQSRVLNKKNAQGEDEVDRFGFPVENDKVEGVSMTDFKKTMMPWIRKFTELKD